MPPAHSPKRAILLAWIEYGIFAAGGQNHNRIIELTDLHVIWIEDPAGAVHNLEGISRKLGRAQHGQVKQRDVFAVAAFLRPCVLGPLLHLQLQFLPL